MNDHVLASAYGAVATYTVQILTEAMWAPARFDNKYVVVQAAEQNKLEILETPLLHFQLSAFLTLTIPGFFGTFLDIRVTGGYSILALLLSQVAIMSWCSIWCKAYKSKCECHSWRSVLGFLRWALTKLGCYALKLRFRTVAMDKKGRSILVKELKSTALSMAFGALVIGLSGTIVIVQTSICAIYVAAEHEFKSTPGLQASSWYGASLTDLSAQCGSTWGFGLTSTFPRHVHLMIIIGITVQMAVQATAAWSRASLIRSLGDRNEQQQQSQAMLRWLSHECRSPAAAAVLTLDVLQEELLPRITTAATTKPDASAHGESSEVSKHHTDLKDVQDGLVELSELLHLVKQPLHSLSGILDNMLLYMQYQRGIQARRSLSNLDMVVNWMSAWSQATALQSMDSLHPTQLTLTLRTAAAPTETSRQLTPAGQVLHTSVNGAALTRMSSLNLRSHVTEATLQQVLSNLMSNAFKYGLSQSGTIELDVQISIVTDPDNVKPELQRAVRVPGAAFDGMAGSIWRRLVSVLKDTQQQDDGMSGTEPASFVKAGGRSGLMLVCVTDQGQGMSADETASLFKPFARLRRGQAAKGTGLGLWLMRKLLESQGGTLQVISPGVEQGSTFIAGVPVAVMPDRAKSKRPPGGAADKAIWKNATSVGLVGGLLDAASASKHQQGRLSVPDLKKTRQAAGLQQFSPAGSLRNMGTSTPHSGAEVLVVDDCVPIRRMMARYLKNAGMTVLTAENGRDGLALLQSQWRAGKPIRAVVTDMTMPIMSGDEMCRHIQRLCDPSQTEGELLPRPALIGITGNAMSEDVDRFTASGAVCVLTKPVSGFNIVNEVRARLDADETMRRHVTTVESMSNASAALTCANPSDSKEVPVWG